MLQSILLAGFLWATANVMPVPTVGTPTVVANTLADTLTDTLQGAAILVPSTVKAPILMASAPRAARLPQVRMVWEMPTPVQTSAPSPGALAAEEQEFIEKVNAERTERGLNALAVDPLLVHTARAHSREMCARAYFDHHSPTPGLSTPMDRYLKGLHDQGGSTPDSLLVGENIYYCSVFNDVYNVDYGHRALMNSPGHRANILEKRFTKIGLGVYRNAQGEFWVTEMFSRDSE
jgi:uncharacterized protein YkwD